MTTVSRGLGAVLFVALAVLGLGCPESETLTGLRAAPTPAPPGLVLASGTVLISSRDCTNCALEGAVVTVRGDGINVSTESGADGRWQLPPFHANIPIVLGCTRPGFWGGASASQPPDGYAPPPGVYTDWGCTFVLRSPGS